MLEKSKRAINTHPVVQAAAHSAVCATFFVQELNKVSLPATTCIVNGLATLGEELYRRERLDFILLGERAIGFGVSVYICNNTLRGIS
jgi:hypothetical protein